MTTILSVQSSARHQGSHSRDLSAKLIEKLASADGDTQVVERDVSANMPIIDETWLAANWTPTDQRTPEQAQTLDLSETLIGELEQADIIVLGVPMYNFAIPAALKAWIDLVARAGRTFRYSEQGPVGLLQGKKAYVVITSGGVPVGSGYDFTTDYIRHVLGFVGITDVSVVAADELVNKEAESLNAANEAIAQLAA